LARVVLVCSFVRGLALLFVLKVALLGAPGTVLLLVVHVFLGRTFQGAFSKEGRVEDVFVVVFVADDCVLVIVEMDDFVKQNCRLVSVLILKLLGF